MTFPVPTFDEFAKVVGELKGEEIPQHPCATGCDGCPVASPAPAFTSDPLPPVVRNHSFGVVDPIETDGEHTPACEACRGFEPHNDVQCTRTAAHDVSGVKLCAYHNAVRGYVPVLYLADGRGMNHAGVVGTPPARPDPGAGAVDALVARAQDMVLATKPEVIGAPVALDLTPGGRHDHDTDDDHPADPHYIAEGLADAGSVGEA